MNRANDIQLLHTILSKHGWFLGNVAYKEDAYGPRFVCRVSENPSPKEIMDIFDEEPPFFCGVRVTFNKIDLRSEIVMLVRKRGSDNRRSWLQLYDRFEEIHGIHILEEAKRCGISGLNYAVKNGLAKKLYLVAKDLWR